MNIAKIVVDLSNCLYTQPVQTIGKNIRDRRETLRWNQAELADAANVNVETVFRAEHDANVGIKKLFAIAEALGARLGELLPDDQRAPASNKGLCDNPEHYRLMQLLDDILHSDIVYDTPEGPVRIRSGIIANVISHHRAIETHGPIRRIVASRKTKV